jgi:hypothetical protein
MPAKKKQVVNPLTGRKIIVGGATHKRITSLINKIGGQPQDKDKPKSQTKQPAEDVRRFRTDVLSQQSDKFFESLIKLPAGKPVPTALAVTTDGEMPVIPKSKFNLISSNLPPAPSGSHSFYHHHAPFSQDFGEYVCLKKDTLRDVGMFLRDSFFRSVENS